jgi:hypothetical protein
MRIPPDNRLAEFESHCREWMRLFGLSEWTATFSYMTDKEHLAEVSYNHISRQAVFSLSRGKRRDRELRLTALHEVWHVVMADLSGMAEEIKASRVVLQEEHKIIARIENYILQTEGVQLAKKKGKKTKGGSCK